MPHVSLSEAASQGPAGNTVQSFRSKLNILMYGSMADLFKPISDGAKAAVKQSNVDDASETVSVFVCFTIKMRLGCEV